MKAVSHAEGPTERSVARSAVLNVLQSQYWTTRIRRPFHFYLNYQLSTYVSTHLKAEDKEHLTAQIITFQGKLIVTLHPKL